MSVEILDPSLPIVDAHHHLRDRDGEIYLADEFLADLATGHRVEASVAVETGVRYRESGPHAMRPVGETEFLAQIAQRCVTEGKPHVAAGIVGFADLQVGDVVQDVLDAHVQAGCGRFRGVRMSAPWHTDARLKYSRSEIEPGTFRDPAFRRGFARLAPMDLTFDAWIYHTQLADVADLARSFPDTTIVLDHVGGPLGAGPYEGRRSEVFDAWRTSLLEVAACPNVAVKIGGFGMPIMGFGFDRASRPPAASDLAHTWRPYVEAAIAAFGAARSMFQSNFPPDRKSAPYATLWNAFKLLASSLTAADRASLFHGTATRVYRLAR